MKKKETICWECKNCTKCTWSRGVPVCGWEAKPTKIAYNDTFIDSYLVEKCPLFRQNDTTVVTVGAITEVAKLLGVTYKTAYSRAKDSVKLEKLNKKLSKKGWHLITEDISGTNRRFILKKTLKNS